MTIRKPESGLTKYQIYWKPDLGFPRFFASVRNKCLLYKPPSLW